MGTAPKTAGHTRGPWEAFGCEIVGDSRVVATVHWCSGLEAEDDANLRLIAASPDLLAALTPFAEQHGMGDNYVQFAPRLIVAARAAIAKATGAAP